MGQEVISVAIVLGMTLIMIFGFALVFIKFYRRIGPNEALVITTPKGVRMARGGHLVLPFVHKAETIDLSTKQLRVERAGGDAPTTTDGTRTDIVVVFYLHVEANEEAVLTAARKIGSDRLRDAPALKELLLPKLAAAIDTLVRNVPFATFERDRDDAEDKLVQLLGHELGLDVDRAVIERVAQTPAEATGPFR